MANVQERFLKALKYFLGGIIALLVLAIAFAIGGGEDSKTTGAAGPGASLAAAGCEELRSGIRSAAAGTSTNAEADAAIAEARRKLDLAVAVNPAYQPLLAMMTSVARGTGDGLAVLAECRRLGV